MTEREQDFRGPHRCSKDDLNLCGLHEYIEEERKEHRALVCGKITKVESGLDNMAKTIVPRWIFSLVMSAAFGFSLLLFYWIGNTVKDGQREVKESLSIIHRRISDIDIQRELLKDSLHNLDVSVNGISVKMNEIEKKISK